jgi:hypothetical protein
MNFKSSNHSPLTKEMLPPLFYIIRFVERVATILAFISPVLMLRKLRIKIVTKSNHWPTSWEIVKYPSIGLGCLPKIVKTEHALTESHRICPLAPEEKTGSLNHPIQAGDMVNSTSATSVSLWPEHAFKVQRPHCNVHLQRHPSCGCCEAALETAKIPASCDQSRDTLGLISCLSCSLELIILART